MILDGILTKKSSFFKRKLETKFHKPVNIFQKHFDEIVKRWSPSRLTIIMGFLTSLQDFRLRVNKAVESTINES